MIIGVALAGLGIALLAGREVTVALPKPQAGTGSRQLRSMVVFGASDALASLSCTLPVFLAVVASTFTRSDLASGIATFAAYATGMSVVLLAVTVALAVAQHSLMMRIRNLGRHLNRVSRGLLVLAGAYIVYYWAFNLSTEPGETTGAGPARFVEGLSADAIAWFQRLGWSSALVLFGGVIATAAAFAVLGRRPAPPGCCSPVDDPASEATPTVDLDHPGRLGRSPRETGTAEPSRDRAGWCGRGHRGSHRRRPPHRSGAGSRLSGLPWHRCSGGGRLDLCLAAAMVAGGARGRHRRRGDARAPAGPTLPANRYAAAGGSGAGGGRRHRLATHPVRPRSRSPMGHRHRGHPHAGRTGVAVTSLRSSGGLGDDTSVLHRRASAVRRERPYHRAGYGGAAPQARERQRPAPA